MVSQYSFLAAFLKQLPYIFLSSFIHHVLHSDTHPCKFCYIMLAAKKKKPKKPQKLNKTKQKKKPFLTADNQSYPNFNKETGRGKITSSREVLATGFIL